MHPANITLWQKMIEPYASKVPGARIVEFGSYDVNGSIRPLFINGANLPEPKYVGVDWRPGPRVDLVSLAHAFPVALGPFDFVVSASMLEHDPHWRESLKRMSDVLASDGVMILSWGAAENNVHECDCAPDGKVHALPASLVIRFLRNLGLHVHRFHYEDEFHSEPVPGGVGLLATWTGLAARGGPPQVSPLHAADEVPA